MRTMPTGRKSSLAKSSHKTGVKSAANMLKAGSLNASATSAANIKTLHGQVTKLRDDFEHQMQHMGGMLEKLLEQSQAAHLHEKPSFEPKEHVADLSDDEKEQ